MITEQRHWKAPDKLEIKREKGFAYKYVRKSDVERRMNEGWEVCRKDEKVLQETGRVDTSQNYRSLILMRIPQHMADERNAHYLNIHKRRIRASGRGASLAAKASDISDGADKAGLSGAIGKGLEMKEGVVTDEGLHHSHTTIIPIDDKVEREEMLEDKQHLDELRDKQANSDKEFATRTAEEEVDLEAEASKSEKKRSKKK